MAFLGDLHLSSIVAVYLQTLSPQTGNVLSADTAPTYRIYANNANTAMITGTFSTIDSANVSGFYAFSLTISAGFTASGTYCVRKHATISSLVIATLDTFRVT